MSQQREALNDLGMVWNAVHARWEEMYGIACRYVTRHDQLQPDRTEVVEGERLGQWVRWQRQQIRRGKLSTRRTEQLLELGIMVDAFDAGIAACDRYIAAHGNLDVPRDYTDPTGYPLGTWIQTQRSREAGDRRRLDDNLRAALDARGMIWRKQRTGGELTDQQRLLLLDTHRDGPRSEQLMRLIVTLVDEEQVAQSAIADALGVTAGAVSARLKRGRLILGGQPT